MSTKIVDHRVAPKTMRADTLHKGTKFDWNRNIFIVTGGMDSDSVECCHLETGQLHNIMDSTMVEPVSIEIHIKAVP